MCACRNNSRDESAWQLCRVVREASCTPHLQPYHFIPSLQQLTFFDFYNYLFDPPSPPDAAHTCGVLL